MKTITVFTPTFNRAHTLDRLYESLCRQTSNDFEWLVIDDGSTDSTRQQIKKWQEENVIPIHYIYQENKGYCEARETAFCNIRTELHICIDSDDWLPDDAIEKIIKLWTERGGKTYAGIIGLDSYADGQIIGTTPHIEIKVATLRDYYEKYGGSGDKKQVYRTDIIKQYPPTPNFEGERFIDCAYKYYLIDDDYPLLVSNDVYCIVEYQTDGLSSNEWKHRWNYPKSYACDFLLHLRQTKSKKKAVNYCLHYIACSIHANNPRFLKESPRKCLTLMLLPFGVVLYLLYWYKGR
ncbi:glycosyltransferase family 2 protein [Prevotella sp. E13-27]|uniref:glycosyltransferase family 2 protein n=1 Tax=Prevotella sp. E13-27 TaxID=2938122 RepID=UPI00200B079C|nr:glycosyltransferase family A protein [Prevotella sp. E13-27]MCK8623644.1 glycosyltransferase family 2 protein [Prevotella sp. E13-27]